MIQRIFQIYFYDNNNKDVIAAKRDFPDIDFRYLVYSSHKFPEIGLQFTHELLHEYLELGY